jgi:hypothetical protein
VSTRWEVERAVLASGLSPRARHIALTLLTLTTPKNCVVPAEFTPSLSRLVELTGYARSTVAKELNALEADGWVVRKRPPVEAARAEKERTRYRLAIPKASPLCGLAGPVDTTLSSPHNGLASPHHGPALVRTTDPGLVRGADSYQTAFQTINQTAGGAPERIVAEATGASPEEAAAIAKRVANERDPRSLVGLLRRMAADGDLAGFLIEHRAAVVKARVADAIAEARSKPDCEHGTAGGDQPHPVTGQPLCPLCRAQDRWDAAGVTA